MGLIIGSQQSSSPSSEGAVRYDRPQSLTPEQKETAQMNIGAQKVTDYIVNDLQTGGSQRALSAEMGKSLNNKINNLALGKFYGIFGSASDLPDGSEIGYAYVGSSNPFAIYNFNGIWSDSGTTIDNATEVVDNLATDDATKALSAAQGKALKDKLSDLDLQINEINYSDELVVESSSGQLSWYLDFPFSANKEYKIQFSGLSDVVASGRVNLRIYQGEQIVYSGAYIDGDILTFSSPNGGDSVWIQRDNKIGIGTVSINITSESRVKQTTGNSTTDWMSQKAVTEELVGKTLSYNFPIVAGQELSYVAPCEIRAGSKVAVTLNVPAGLLTPNRTNIRFINSASQTELSDVVESGTQKVFVMPSDVASIELQRDSTTGTGTGTIAFEIKRFYSIGDSEKEYGNKTFYVSPNGADSAYGDTDHPLKTFNKALEKGATRILAIAGVYEQTINLNLAQKGELVISPASEQSSVIIKSPNAIKVNDGTETLVSGKTRVYKKTFSTNPIDTTNQRRIYQEGVPDSSTLITDAERHPLQRGKEHRLENTIIHKCSSNVLSDAIDEIESDTTLFKWYYDTDTLTLYFSRPMATSSSHALVIPSENGKLFENTMGCRGLRLSVAGIDVWYQSFNLNYLALAHISNCSAKYAFAMGGFSWTAGIGAVLEKCEAASIQYGVNGDGFNADHGFIAEDPFAKQTIARLIDCWSHDNNDDGYSSHERCESTIQGGLFEYNHKAGVTPAFGEHCQCYDVWSRKNYSGIFYTAVPASWEGGKYGQVICYNCVVAGNSVCGFRVNGAGNKLIAVGCKSLNNPVGYQCEENARMELIDCGSSGDTTQKAGDGTFAIINTQLVSA